MKKLLLLIAICVFCTQCSTSDSDVVDDTSSEMATYSVFVDGDFFIPNSSGKVYISDSDGTILGDAELINNESSLVEILFDPTASYDITIYFEAITNGTQFHFLNTYTNIDPGNFSMIPPRGFNANGDDITITLTNTGSNLEIVSTSPGFVTSESNTDNGGTFIINGQLIASPGFFYASFKSPNDNLPRYSWNVNLSGSTQVESEFTSLPFVDAPITVNLPSNETYVVTARGLMDADPSGPFGISHILQVEESEDGSTSLDMRLPGGIFDKHKLVATYTTTANTTTHEFQKLSTALEQNVPNPTIDFSVNSNTIGNFSMDTTGEYDIYDATLVYENNAQDVVIIFDVFGASNATVNFNKSNLFDNIFASDPDISASILPGIERVTLTNYSQVASYEDFIQGQLLYNPELLENEIIERAYIF